MVIQLPYVGTFNYRHLQRAKSIRGMQPCRIARISLDCLDDFQKRDKIGDGGMEISWTNHKIRKVPPPSEDPMLQKQVRSISSRRQSRKIPNLDMYLNKVYACYFSCDIIIY